MANAPDPAGTFRRGFTRITQRSAVRSGLEDYDRTVVSTIRSMNNQVSRRGNMRPLDVRQMLVTARESTNRHAGRMISNLVSSQLEAQTDALQTLARFIARREGGSALDERAVFRRILDQRRAEMTRAAENTVVTMMGRINQTVGQTVLEAVNAGDLSRQQLLRIAQEAYEAELWQVERAVRTQASVAFNATVTDGIHILGEQFPDMRIRWVELVSDQTGEPLDNRVANDSLALHAQLKTTDGVFVMPRDRRVPAALHGKTYEAPPNRPNDRAVLMPWRKSWGIPGWVYREGTRRWVVRRTG